MHFSFCLLSTMYFIVVNNLFRCDKIQKLKLGEFRFSFFHRDIFCPYGADFEDIKSIKLSMYAVTLFSNDQAKIIFGVRPVLS
jgi:hypothetical protein